MKTGCKKTRRSELTRLICLVENAVLLHSPFWGEHGLSVLVETPGGCVLFDTGANGTVLLHNLEAAGVDPESIRALALSRGRRDHTLLQVLGPEIIHPFPAGAQVNPEAPE